MNKLTHRNYDFEHNPSQYCKFCAYLLAIICVISNHAAMALTTINRVDIGQSLRNGSARYNPSLFASSQNDLNDNDITTTNLSTITAINRRSMIRQFASTFLVGATTTSYASQNPSPANAAELPKSYSSNARNLDRLSSGDSSGGSTYDNYPKTDRAARRRAMEGCKVDSARKEADVQSLRECNLRVMDGDTEFMLDALRALDCPTCPYGIKGA
eukprot:CAMPEP_0185733276 /NCGR_PEP_ID=MMETSP1171-20130828/18989_1 /TAXON_ID=374046 /ORGANISM="Helicotheca tamensis, Strain CCMP826" /LENGTH=213 /DNA_ID=CAMNT_0028402959 /DNA_START=69 /DNA_END=710 /DNA_ORIENTATION=+